MKYQNKYLKCEIKQLALKNIYVKWKLGNNVKDDTPKILNYNISSFQIEELIFLIIRHKVILKLNKDLTLKKKEDIEKVIKMLEIKVTKMLKNQIILNNAKKYLSIIQNILLKLKKLSLNTSYITIEEIINDNNVLSNLYNIITEQPKLQ